MDREEKDDMEASFPMEESNFHKVINKFKDCRYCPTLGQVIRLPTHFKKRQDFLLFAVWNENINS